VIQNSISMRQENPRDANERYGRPFFITASLVIWVVILCLFRLYGYDETWKLWRVPVEHPQFSDFRLIPGSAETFRSGIEPTQRNPGDPHKRIFNYPAFWRLFFYTGITQQDTVWIVVAMLVLFFAGVFLFPNQISVLDSVGLLLIVFSPASMLLYERGNVDLIVFFLCALVILASDYSAVLTASLLVFAVVVKIFPFFGVGVLLRESKAKFLWLSSGCLLALTLYMLKTFKSVSAAWNLTMRGDEISYGANVLFLRYDRYFSELTGAAPSSPFLKFGPLVLAFVLILIAGLIGLRNREPLNSSSARNLAAFRMGASIYAGTFLLGNNWDYRLAFLILAAPQLLHWTRRAYPAQYRFMAAITLAMIYASCWHFIAWYAPSLAGMKEFLFVLDELCNWILAAGCSYLLFASAPEWMKEQFLFRSSGKNDVQAA